jgi:DNA-binding CsgD family transcriptional regulator
MSDELTPRGPVRPLEAADTRPMVRSAPELVELAERLYMNVWGLGLRVALIGIGTSAVSVALRGALVHQVRAGLVVGCTFAAMLGAARWHSALYHRLRRSPVETLLFGAAGGAAQWWIGKGSDAVYVAIIVPLGLLGLACGWRWLLPAAFLAAVGQLVGAGPHSDTITVGTVAASEVILPLSFVAVADRLATFILRLNQSLEVGRPPPRRVRAVVDTDRVPVSEPEERHAQVDRGAGRPPGVKFTPRQLQATLLASQGLRHLEIAACMGVSVRQAARLLSQARSRNACATTGELIAVAIAAGIVPSVHRAA